MSWFICIYICICRHCWSGWSDRKPLKGSYFYEVRGVAPRPQNVVDLQLGEEGTKQHKFVYITKLSKIKGTEAIKNVPIPKVHLVAPFQVTYDDFE